MRPRHTPDNALVTAAGPPRRRDVAPRGSDSYSGAMSRPPIVLVSPPWRAPSEPCLALATLAPILRAQGNEVVVLHGALDYPDTEVDALFMASYAGHLFATATVEREGRAALLELLVERFRNDLNLGGMLVPGASLADLGRDEEAMRAWVEGQVEHAASCLETIVSRVVGHSPEVVLMSATFEGQLVAARAIARAVKARCGARVALGGAACFEDAAVTLVSLDEALDAVCFAEGEAVVWPLVQALRDGRVPDDVPGVAWRRPDGEVGVGARPERRPLDESPIPDYDDYFAALATSRWRGVPARLYFELSRGCWWGQKHLCTFCGLNAESLDFRDKSTARAVAEIEHLHGRYPLANRLAAVDNILGMTYLREVMPRLEPLATSARPLRLFFEVKSNLRRDQLAALARAGVRHLQPGIESFDDDILALMKKGATGLGQIQFIKWCAELGVVPSYNLIVMNPGEETASYVRMLGLIDALDHLPSPENITTMWLERFSPYHGDPARWGIRDVRARRHVAGLYPDLAERAPEALERLAYVFDFDHERLASPDHQAAVRSFALRVGRWQYDWEEVTAHGRRVGQRLVLTDRREGREATIELSPESSALYAWLDQVRPSSTLTADRFAGCDIASELADWARRGWVVSDGRDRWLATLPVFE